MKVAMIGLRSLDEGVGGVEKAVREVSTRLVTNGVDVTCYCRPHYNDRSEFEGVKLVNTRTVNSKHLETAFYAVGSLWKAAKSDADVVHIHAMASSVLAWIPKWIGKKKVVITVHGLDWQRAKWGWVASRILMFGEWCAVRFADSIICVSLSLQTYFQMRYIQQTFAAIPNGCDPLDEQEYPAPEGYQAKQYLLYMGRLVPEKGAHRLIKAFRQVKTDMQLVIAGPLQHAEAYGKELRALAEGDERIQFVGSIAGDEKEKFLRNAYLFVLPSEIEGLPIALLEAASRGVCPLVSSIPTAVEVLGDHALSRGFVVNAKSVSELTTAMETAIDNPELVDSLGKTASEYVFTRYNWDRIARQTQSVYENLFGDSSL